MYTPTGYVKNLVNGVIAPNFDANNYQSFSVSKHGIFGSIVQTNNSTSITTGPLGLLHGLQNFTLVRSFIFQSGRTSSQDVGFRVDLQHTIDVFSQTTSSVNWGSDWAGAWNGASQQTLSGLTDGDLVTIVSSIRSNGGARFFHQGRFSGAKSGSAFTVSTASSSGRIYNGTLSQLQNAAFATALTDEECIMISANPWCLLNSNPVRIYSLPSAAPGVPTSLLNQNLAATSFRSAWTAPA
jgi:hypothetical protein